MGTRAIGAPGQRVATVTTSAARNLKRDLDRPASSLLSRSDSIQDLVDR
jgi:hypothetical protein